MVRPFPLLAVILTAIALAFYIAAAASADWLESLQANTQIYEGPYNVCWRQHDAGIRGQTHRRAHQLSSSAAASMHMLLLPVSVSAVRVPSCEQ